MSEWKKYKLGEVVEIKYGKDHKHLANGTIPVYGSGGIMRLADSSLYDKESILIPRKGTLSNLFYLNKPFWSVDTMFYTKIKQGNNGRYLFYLLKSIDLASMNVGSAVPSLTTEILNKLELTLPPLPTQTRIATILSSLDDKIELNRQTNQTLEAIAQTLFKEMCVPSGDELPKGWRKGKLGELGEFKNGINYSRDENGDTEFSIVNVRDVVDNKFLLKDNLSKINIDRKKAKPYLLEVDDIVIVRSASPGETAILFFPEENIIYSGFTIRYRINNKNHFLYYFFIFQSLKKQLDNLSNGTTLKNVNQEMLKAYEIIIPDERSIQNFNIKVEPIYQMVLSNFQEIQTLTTLRDSLLPKLMKGEIEV